MFQFFALKNVDIFQFAKKKILQNFPWKLVIRFWPNFVIFRPILTFEVALESSWKNGFEKYFSKNVSWAVYELRTSEFTEFSSRKFVYCRE